MKLVKTLILFGIFGILLGSVGVMMKRRSSDYAEII